MILRICPYQISNNKQCSHFRKTIVSIANWLISHVKIHVHNHPLQKVQRLDHAWITPGNAPGLAMQGSSRFHACQALT